MPLNYFYATNSYLSDWVAYDREARKVLGFKPGHTPEYRAACKQLMSVAKGYSVSRNFGVAAENGSDRLSSVWEALQKIEEPTSDQDAKDCVKKLVEDLSQTYNRELWSAASKFLWMRFDNPIIIYDSLAWNWMHRNGGCSSGGGYNGFYDAWRKTFEDCRKEVGAACEELLRLKARKFLCPSDVSDEEFELAVSSPWFAERVFDHAIVNESSETDLQGKV